MTGKPKLCLSEPMSRWLVVLYGSLDIKVVLIAFEGHCRRQRNEIAETFRSQQLQQNADNHGCVPELTKVVTEWFSNIQMVKKKKGKLRVCLDPRPINERENLYTNGRRPYGESGEEKGVFCLGFGSRFLGCRLC